MKQILLAIAVVVLAGSCQTQPRTAIQKKADEYALVKVGTPDLSGITDNGKEVLNLYKFAADQADSIYWQQFFGDRAAIDALPDADLKAYAAINYGPWDRLTGVPFIEGYGTMPLGANFYPADMTADEFVRFEDPSKNSPYTLIRRGADGKLVSVPYHEAFAAQIDKICNCLQAAADITIKPSVRAYLLKKCDALRSDDYYESENAWLDMTDSKMDLVIGPSEVNDDRFFGLKASYDAYVLLKDLERTAVLNQFGPMLPTLQKMLPCADAYKAFVPGTESDVFACDAIYMAGHANAGIKLMAINLPNDPRVQEEKGTRTILLRNIMMEKFNRVVSPVGHIAINVEQTGHLDAEAFYWNIAFREIAHGLGVKETVNGKGTVAEALGGKALTWEDAKANVVGLYLVCKLLDEHKLPGLTLKEDAITTFVANLIRSERFGVTEQLGRAYVMIFNYLYENGAFTRADNGRYTIDFDKTLSLVADLAGIILKTQAEGDYAFAEQFESRYCKESETFRADLTNMRLENIPVDLKFEFEK